MAFLNIDPNPMMLPSFSRMVVQGREPFIRMVTPRATPRNEDLAIVTVTPLPNVEVPFGEIRDVVLGLLVEDYELQVRDIQMCPFGRGQAFVRFARLSDRDGLIAHNPHHHLGFTLNFVQHNRGDNARRVNFNRECWLMLIGYPPDYRSNEEIGDTIKSFGRLLFWQRDNVLARIIIKARVTDLADIPHYIIISEGDFFEGVSLTVQCEILQQDLLGGMPRDEDIPPGGFDGDFVFPGQINNNLQQLNWPLWPQHHPHAADAGDELENGNIVGPDMNFPLLIRNLRSMWLILRCRTLLCLKISRLARITQLTILRIVPQTSWGLLFFPPLRPLLLSSLI
jgi:hypothetical protein